MMRKIIYHQSAVKGRQRLFHLQLWTFSFLLLIGAVACKKNKSDFAYDHAPVSQELSAVRVINLGSYTQVAANNDTLTNLGSVKKTVYFPETGMLRETWALPASLLSGNGQLDMQMWNTDGDTIRFAVSGNGKTPQDYYALNTRGTGQPGVVQVERASSGPSKPDHFKIRIINLMKQLSPDLDPVANTGPLEDVTGNISLVYADGTPVSDQTSNIGTGSPVSEYTELPYGAYQFRVLTADGRQVSAIQHRPGQETSALLMDPATSRIPVPGTAQTVSSTTYAPVYTYQPGGVYTIVVSPQPFLYLIYNRSDEFATGYQNLFRIVEDNSITANLQYGKLQGVNALPGKTVSFRINGEVVDGETAYGKASAYRILSAGSYTVEAVDTSGKVLAQTAQSLSANQNHSVWLWQDSAGRAQLTPVANDLSSEYYYDRSGQNGINNRYADALTTGIRFLNLCPDEPYISFTIDDGQDMRNNTQLALGGGYEVADDAIYNLQPGTAPAAFPYTRWITSYDYVFRFLAFRSRPGVVPGSWLSDIPGLSGYYFVANPALYTTVTRSVPTLEPGIYTVALVGRNYANAPADMRAKMIIIKHNK
ncbi:MAG: DUF4397 domain-containing protein [Chitinophagaceae bacterium]|nr:DUF4397 domain-containing protein [Chitinophagaceae bacterium]